MRKALIIGAEADGLAGVLNDVATMTELLSARGFEVDPRTGEDATREGILAGLDRLVTGSRDGDVIVVYYSGHGGLARVFAPNGKPLPELQFIVPTDYHRSGPRDFRGVTDIELSVWLQRLTEVTRNVTVILDCCNAAHQVRGGLRTRALPHPSYLDIAVHRGMLIANGLPEDQVHPIGNPHAVRIVACSPWESSYEYTNSRGLDTGLLTDSLRVALDRVGSAPVTWSALMQQVRDRVTALQPQQHPAAEGPNKRILFALDEDRGGTRFTVVRTLADDNQLSLRGAGLLGARPGDTFGLTAAGAARADETTIVANAVVSRRDGADVRATFELSAGQVDLPPATEAHPLVTAEPGAKVLVSGAGPPADLVRSVLAVEPTLWVAHDDDPPDDDPLLAEVRVGEGLALWDGGSVPLRTAAGDPAGVADIRDDLVLLARAARLRRLTPEADEELTEPFSVAWGRVVDGQAEPLDPSGDLLHAGERFYVQLRNTSERPLHFFVFDVGVAGAVTLVTHADPSGLRIDAGQEYIVGERGNVLRGFDFVWPEGIPIDDPRPETLLVIVTAASHDLSVLTQKGLQKSVRGKGSSLRALVSAVARGEARNWRGVEEPNDRYAVARIPFRISALPAPPRETARFLIDELPDISLRLVRTTPSDDRPAAVKVRLTDLVVDPDGPLRGVRFRLDTLILTGSGGDLPRYEARTFRFHDVPDGGEPAGHDLLLYHGPVADHLDLAWWVSPDRPGSPTLDDLLRQRSVAREVLAAVAPTAAMAAAAPHAAPAAVAVGATATLVNLADELLSQAVGDGGGRYRTSLLDSEGFGVGRHPVPAKDVSFGYEVVAD